MDKQRALEIFEMMLDSLSYEIELNPCDLLSMDQYQAVSYAYAILQGGAIDLLTKRNDPEQQKVANRQIMQKQLINEAGQVVAECEVGCDFSKISDFTPNVDCDHAIKTSCGLCNGYCYAENNDEPIDQCKICKEHVSRVDGEAE